MVQYILKIYTYLGMVKNRPMLINNYMNFLYMLGTSNTSNTKKDISEKVEDVTMSNQQEAWIYIFLITFENMYIYILGILRDYTRNILKKKIKI